MNNCSVIPWGAVWSVGMPGCVARQLRLREMTILEALRKIVGPGHGRAGRILAPGSNDYRPSARTGERV